MSITSCMRAAQIGELALELAEAFERRLQLVGGQQRKVRERGVGDQLLATVGPVELERRRVGRRDAGVGDRRPSGLRAQDARQVLDQILDRAAARAALVLGFEDLDAGLREPPPVRRARSRPRCTPSSSRAGRRASGRRATATNAGSISRWIRSVGITPQLHEPIGAPTLPWSPAMGGQRGVRIDGAAVRTAGPDLEVQLRRGVARRRRCCRDDRSARPPSPSARHRRSRSGARSNRCCRRGPRTYAALPPSGSPWKKTDPSVTATNGVPAGAKRSLPWWRRPPLRGEPNVSVNETGPCTGTHPRSVHDDLTGGTSAARRAVAGPARGLRARAREDRREILQALPAPRAARAGRPRLCPRPRGARSASCDWRLHRASALLRLRRSRARNVAWWSCNSLVTESSCAISLVAAGRSDRRASWRGARRPRCRSRRRARRRDERATHVRDERAGAPERGEVLLLRGERIDLALRRRLLVGNS